MKNKQHRNNQLLQQLRYLKSKGVKNVVWKLTKEQRLFLERHFFIENHLYTIRTKKLVRVDQVKSNLLKDVHYTYKRGKLEMVRQLKKNDCRMLDEYGISYKPYKFMIHLNQ